MSIHTITEYIEVPVTVVGEYIPAEKPDYSELSPCPGHPEEVEFLSMRAPYMPNPIIEATITALDPGFWDRAKEAIIQKAKGE